MRSIDNLLEKFSSGNVRALSRLISLVENDPEAKDYILSKIFKDVGDGYRIGITGPPGAGKSTLVDTLASKLHDSGKKVSIIAVDPSSPFTGGALLGDRYRMYEAMKRGIFIRSLASRGSLGGLSESTIAVADLLDAFGSEIILIETVGVGQSELDIMNASDTVVVTLVPESGDSIQAMKAGLMEIADIFVINKFDREGAKKFEMELRTVLSMSNNSKNGWKPPVIRTVATKGEGIDELIESIFKHYRFLKEKGILARKRRERIRREITESIKEKLWGKYFLSSRWRDNIEKCVDKVISGEETPYSVVEKIINEI